MNFAELEKRFDGVYDFTVIQDCHKVIKTLLQSLNTKDQALSFENNRIIELADAVMKDDPKAKEKAEQFRKGKEIQKRSPAEVMAFIKRMVENTAIAEKMSDEQLYEAAFDVYADEDMASQKSAIISELLNRFKKKKKIKSKGV